MRVRICNRDLWEPSQAPRNWISGLVCIALVYGLCVFFSAYTIAQESQTAAPPPVSSDQETTPPPPKSADQSAQKAAPAEPETQPNKKDKKKSSKLAGLVVAPLPISSPAIGSGIVPVIGYIFPFSKNDKVSPPSTVGVAGLVTNNGSRGFAVGGQLFLKENTYEITSGFARGNVNYNIYGTGIAADVKLPLQQTGNVFFGEFLRRVGWKFFAGPRLITGRSDITLRPSSVTSVVLPANLDSQGLVF